MATWVAFRDTENGLRKVTALPVTAASAVAAAEAVAEDGLGEGTFTMVEIDHLVRVVVTSTKDFTGEVEG